METVIDKVFSFPIFRFWAYLMKIIPGHEH
jgi:hypothetical protein